MVVGSIGAVTSAARPARVAPRAREAVLFTPREEGFDRVLKVPGEAQARLESGDLVATTSRNWKVERFAPDGSVRYTIDLHDTARSVLIDEEAGRLYVETFRMFWAFDLETGTEQGVTWLPGWRQEGVVGRDGLFHVEGGREVKTYDHRLQQIHDFTIPFSPSRTSYLRNQDVWVFEDTDDRSPNQVLITDRQGRPLYQSPGERLFLDPGAPGEEGWMIQRKAEGQHELVCYRAEGVETFPCPERARLALPTGERLLLLDGQGWRVLSRQGEELGAIDLGRRQPLEVYRAGDRVFTLDQDEEGNLSLTRVDAEPGGLETVLSLGRPDKAPLIAATSAGQLVVHTEQGVLALDPEGRQVGAFDTAGEAREELGGKLSSRAYSLREGFHSATGWDAFNTAARARFRSAGGDFCLDFSVPVDASEVHRELGLSESAFQDLVRQGGEISRMSTLPELGHTVLDVVVGNTGDHLVTNETGTYRVKAEGGAERIWGAGFRARTTVALPVGIGERVYLLQGDDQGGVSLVPEKNDIMPVMRFGMESAVKGLELVGGHLVALGMDGSVLLLQPTLKEGEQPFTLRQGESVEPGEIEVGDDEVLLADFAVAVRQD